MTDKRVLTVVAPLLLLATPLGYQSAGTTQTPARRQPDGLVRATSDPKRLAATLDKLKTLLEPVGITVDKSSLVDGDIRNVRALILKWEAYPGETKEMLSAEEVKGRQIGKNVSLVESKTQQHTQTWMTMRYVLDLTSDQLLVASVDAESRLKWWELLDDPRVIHGEWVEADGRMAGAYYYRTQPGMYITLPDVPEIREVRIFFVRWTNEQYFLEPLATIPVPE
jgi:hypothetical protein